MINLNNLDSRSIIYENICELSPDSIHYSLYLLYFKKSMLINTERIITEGKRITNFWIDGFSSFCFKKEGYEIEDLDFYKKL